MKDSNPCIKEAILYEKINDKINCNTCERLCEIPLNSLGSCKTRKNIDGRLYTIEYGDISSFSANPIEKKPFFHFYPGSYAFTVGSWGCNFNCPWCQNYDISKSPPDPKKCNYMSPENFIRLMIQEKCQGTSISFNEPTLLLEYSMDVFDLAKKEGCYNTYVTNGYMTSEALKLLTEHGLEAANFDVKGDAEIVNRYCGADVEKVWRNIREAKNLGVHVEVTTLLIPNVNDDEDCLCNIAKRIRREIGENTPWHITQYYPFYKSVDVGLYTKTPVEILEKAWNIGKKQGLNYVYVGNIPGHRLENTYCHNCNELIIERFGFDVVDYRMDSDNKCPKCKQVIPIVGKYRKT
ncbi:AmmeMemoRadiSam system radical SAM enzyme [[Eubacterium] cellulosolvens]